MFENCGQHIYYVEYKDLLVITKSFLFFPSTGFAGSDTQ